MTEIPDLSAIPDWSREYKKIFSWSPSKSLLASIRSYQKHHVNNDVISKLACRLASYRWHFWSVITASDIDKNATLGGGLLLPHPTGVVIHKDAIIGPNCMIMQQVTVGQTGKAGVPRIGGKVYLGAGAKILGPVTLGNHVNIGANAVVLCDVPDGCTAVGVPASIIRQPQNNNL
jgi:serine O-acetyltransferase